jgi:hypothetical protein
MEKKFKHMEMVQNIINRMSSNSFFIKGWCVTLVSALFVLSPKDANVAFIFVAFFPVLMFWILDAYFLRQERLFRKLYEKIRNTDENGIDFSMDTTPFISITASWLRTVFSRTLFLFYGAVFVAVLLASFIAIRLI